MEREVIGDKKSLTDEEKVLADKLDEFYVKAKHLMEQYDMHGFLIAVQEGENNKKHKFFPSSGLCEMRCGEEAMGNLLYILDKTLNHFKEGFERRMKD